MIVLDAEVESISTRKDRTVKVVLGTQEMKDVSQVFNLQNQLVTIGISTNGLNQSEVEILRSSKFDLDAIPDGKTPSQRLRGVLYRCWEQDSGGYEDFNLYYHNRMERIIEHYKTKLG